MKILRKLRTAVALAAVSVFAVVSSAFADPTPLETAMTTATDTISALATTLGGYVVLAFVAAIGLGAIGFGLKYVWRMFRGAAK